MTSSRQLRANRRRLRLGHRISRRFGRLCRRATRVRRFPSADLLEHRELAIRAISYQLGATRDIPRLLDGVRNKTPKQVMDAFFADLNMGSLGRVIRTERGRRRAGFVLRTLSVWKPAMGGYDELESRLSKRRMAVLAVTAEQVEAAEELLGMAGTPLPVDGFVLERLSFKRLAEKWWELTPEIVDGARLRFERWKNLCSRAQEVSAQARECLSALEEEGKVTAADYDRYTAEVADVEERVATSKQLSGLQAVVAEFEALLDSLLLYEPPPSPQEILGWVLGRDVSRPGSRDELSKLRLEMGEALHPDKHPLASREERKMLETLWKVAWPAFEALRDDINE